MKPRSKARSIISRLGNALGLFQRPEPGSKTLYIHVGTHKTGTSALQLFLSRNRKPLAYLGISYPLAGCTEAGAHHYIANALIGPPFTSLKPEKTREEYLDALAAEFGKAHSVVLSSEIFMRLLPSFGPNASKDLAGIRQLLSVADQVRPIVYFRPQEDYMESFYRQRVLEQLKFTPEEFVKRRYLDYFAVCSDLAQAFGRENIIVKPYDRTQFFGNSLFSDFLSIFDIGDTKKFSSSDLKLNPSFVPDAIEFRRLVNCLGAKLDEAIRFNAVLGDYSRLQKSTGDPAVVNKHFLDSALRNVIREKSEKINARISAEYLNAESFFPSGYGGELPLDELNIYRGLSEESLDSILEFLQQNSPELIQLLRRILGESGEHGPDAAVFAAMLSARFQGNSVYSAP